MLVDLVTHIVLATDGSPDAIAARKATAALAAATGAHVHVVQAWQENVAAYNGLGAVAPITEQLEREAWRTVAAETEALIAAGVVGATQQVARGRAAAVVLDLAEHLAADLIIVGSRRSAHDHP